MPWPAYDTTALTEAFRRAVLRLFVRRGLFEPDEAQELRQRIIASMTAQELEEYALECLRSQRTIAVSRCGFAAMGDTVLAAELRR